MIEQKLNAYVVSLNFASGKNVVQTVFAPGPEGAAAIVTHDIMLKPEIRDETALVGCLVGSIAEEWLRTAHRVIVEGGKPEGEVVRLVSDNLRPAPQEVMPQDHGHGHVWGAGPLGDRCMRCGQACAFSSDICGGGGPSAA